MLHAKPPQTPMISSSRLSKDGLSHVFDPTTYRVIVGALQYITLTRLEIASFVNKVCQYMQAPQEHHWKAVKQILRYLASTSTHGILIRSARDLCLVGFSDSDWGSDVDDRQTLHIGYFIYFGFTLVS